VIPRSLGLLPLLVLACAPAAPPQPAAGPPGVRRAIMVSFDAMNEERARGTVSPEAIPEFLQLFDQASCTDGARPMWPSVTAASHAALWTGVYGNVNGVVANSQAPLPWREFSLTELLSGFEPRELRAEPIWITAARAGRTVVGHHVTHSGQPGRWQPDGGRDTAGIRTDINALASPRLLLMNGFAGGTAPRLLSAARNPPRLPGPWLGLAALGNIGVELREVSWAVGDDSLHALFFGADGYREAVVSPVRDVARGVRVRPQPVERDPIEGRSLARHFSDVLWMDVGEGRAGLYLRLFELAPDLSSYRLYQTNRATVRTNHAGAFRAYEDAVGAFVAGAGNVLLESGAARPTIHEGGDGTAELEYLETAELLTRQFVRGSAWLWRNRRPNLQVEYFPLADGLDHTWFGLVSPGVPGYDAGRAARVNAMRNRGWALVNLHLAGLRELARQADALLVVAGDHGMRANWRLFHVNTALERAGLLATDAEGRPDPSRSQAIASMGYFVNVNKVQRKGGTVLPGAVSQIADSVARVLLAARGPDGAPIVTRIWRPTPDDTLGIGGPTGGDVYFDLAPGYYYSAARSDSVVTARSPVGNHGFPSIERDMYTVLCAIGPGIGGRRLPTARVIDAAPTVAAWLGIAPPSGARGVSLLNAMRR
jgi:hypothetical protein